MITTRSAKAKGKRLEAKVRDALLQTFPELDPETIRRTVGCETGADLKLSGKALEVIGPYQWECKAHASVAVMRHVEQCRRHGPHKPIVVIQEDRGKPHAILALDDLLELLRR